MSLSKQEVLVGRESLIVCRNLKLGLDYRSELGHSDMRVINRNSLQAIATSNSEHHGEESGIIGKPWPPSENLWEWDRGTKDLYRILSCRRKSI